MAKRPSMKRVVSEINKVIKLAKGGDRSHVQARKKLRVLLRKAKANCGSGGLYVFRPDTRGGKRR